LRNGHPLDFYDAVIGGRSVGVPGIVRLLEETHQGKAGLRGSALFEPAIALADSGFPMSAPPASLAGHERYITQPRFRAYLYDANGKVPARRRRRCAIRLRKDAARRSPATARVRFYEGDIARDIVETVDDASLERRGQSRFAILASTR
jgi:gamma-glutamyltranspeptidase/glutathione hydrolase